MWDIVLVTDMGVDHRMNPWPLHLFVPEPGFSVNL